MEHPASKYHPHHLEASRVFPAEHLRQLRQRRLKVPDRFCYFFSLGNKLLGHFCPSLLFEKSKEGQIFVSHLDSPSSGTGSSRFLSGELLMAPEPWLWPRSSCCPGATAAPPQHPGPLHRMQWPVQAAESPGVLPGVIHIPNSHLLQENPTYSFPTLPTP